MWTPLELDLENEPSVTITDGETELSIPFEDLQVINGFVAKELRNLKE